jgi:hypothetical protein
MVIDDGLAKIGQILALGLDPLFRLKSRSSSATNPRELHWSTNEATRAAGRAERRT